MHSASVLPLSSSDRHLTHVPSTSLQPSKLFPRKTAPVLCLHLSMGAQGQDTVLAGGQAGAGGGLSSGPPDHLTWQERVGPCFSNLLALQGDFLTTLCQGIRDAGRMLWFCCVCQCGSRLQPRLARLCSGHPRVLSPREIQSPGKQSQSSSDSGVSS